MTLTPNTNTHSDRDRLILNTAGFLRSFGVGFLGVVLGVYLFRAGFSSLTIGLVVSAGLTGAALATIAVSLAADRFGRKTTLLVLSLLSALGGIALAVSHTTPILLFLALISMLNGTGTDRSASYSLEQAIIPGLAASQRRTWNLAFYNVLIDGGGSLGALCAGLPVFLHDRYDFSLLGAYRVVFMGYSAACLLISTLYLLLSHAIEVEDRSTAKPTLAPATKKIVFRLAFLFSLDAFGGGFLTDAIVSYWFFRRFGIAEHDLGLVFFAVHVLNAGSHLAAAWLAQRIGLVNTMVFTHLPSSLFLIAVPFAPSFKWAAVLFFCREALVEMDVPTRQSYVAALVTPKERTLASGITNLTRNVFWAIGSAAAGLLMQILSFSTPLIVGGGAKVLYDALLYRSFRKIKPPEEKAQS